MLWAAVGRIPMPLKHQPRNLAGTPPWPPAQRRRRRLSQQSPFRSRNPLRGCALSAGTLPPCAERKDTVGIHRWCFGRPPLTTWQLDIERSKPTSTDCPGRIFDLISVLFLHLRGPEAKPKWPGARCSTAPTQADLKRSLAQAPADGETGDLSPSPAAHHGATPESTPRCESAETLAGNDESHSSSLRDGALSAECQPLWKSLVTPGSNGVSRWGTRQKKQSTIRHTPEAPVQVSRSSEAVHLAQGQSIHTAKLDSSPTVTSSFDWVHDISWARWGSLFARFLLNSLILPSFSCWKYCT
ncbi:hypothetical protein QBC34DRAFT_91115 [Podospora aff. communis PSN243]|uniref:Uncharacterized protein n=1 Tax=Podospora aff. communis PSN243 TaxID=3040156 RepID=A0AAV9GKX6_9PEZI|nr:hypothetical protein QBC34DRAFT_91115 [Podospora aff. communis PSN243]